MFKIRLPLKKSKSLVLSNKFATPWNEFLVNKKNVVIKTSGWKKMQLKLRKNIFCAFVIPKRIAIVSITIFLP